MTTLKEQYKADVVDSLLTIAPELSIISESKSKGPNIVDGFINILALLLAAQIACVYLFITSNKLTAYVVYVIGYIILRLLVAKINLWRTVRRVKRAVKDDKILNSLVTHQPSSYDNNRPIFDEPTDLTTVLESLDGLTLFYYQELLKLY